jgi:hypothetical protein
VTGAGSAAPGHFRSRWPRLHPLPVLLVVALLASACGAATSSPSAAGGAAAPSGGVVSAIAARAVPGGAEAPVDAAAWALADRLTAPAYTSDTTAALVEGVARSGIGTYADTTSATPDVALTALASPFELLDFQAHALAVGAWTGATWSGAELDGVVPVPTDGTGLAPTSALLAGYVGAVDSPGAALSRALMAGQDLLHPATLRFPAVVLVLFASDMATAGGHVAAPSASPSAAALDRSRLLAFAGSGPGGVDALPGIALNSICSDTANWIQGMIDSLFNALKLATPTNVVGAIFTSIWNFVVDKLQAFVQGLISSVTDALLGTIKSVAGMISAVAEQIASLVPYGVRVTALGGTKGATFNLGPDPQRGEYSAVVTAGDLPAWPAVLSDCASVAKVDLPNFAAKAVPVTFGPLEPSLNPLIVPTDNAATTTVTDATGLAAWPFLTSRDPGDPTGEQQNQFDYMPVAVHRPELDRLRTALSNALFGFVPGLLRPFVDALFAPYLDGLQGRLNDLLDAHGTGAAVLVFHDKVPPTPSPSVSSSPAPSGGCSPSPVPAGSYAGTYTYSQTLTTGAVVDHYDGVGTVTLTVAADGTLSGTWGATLHRTYDLSGGGIKDHLESTSLLSDGLLTGTTCNLIAGQPKDTPVSCLDSKFGDCRGTAGTFQVAGPGVPFGRPTAGAAGSFTWQVTDNEPPANGITGFVRITVSGQ